MKERVAVEGTVSRDYHQKPQYCEATILNLSCWCLGFCNGFGFFSKAY